MDILVERCAGLDVHRDSVAACARLPGKGRQRDQHAESFGTTTAELARLREWLVGQGVSRVGMESTGVYWRPVFYALEHDVECWLLNPAHMRRVPGRKTDVSDAEWICQITEHGLLSPSFVPPPPIRRLRMATRYRRALVEERGRQVQRLDKVLQDTGLKLTSVATDILGRSSRDILAALITGEADPEVLAELSRGVLRKKIPLLKEALACHFEPHHGAVVAQMLASIDAADEAITATSATVAALVEPYRAQVELLCSIPGVSRRTAEALIAELGADVGRFGSAERMASWAGVCPGNNESAGKRRRPISRKGPRWLGAYLSEAAAAAGRTETFLGARYRRIRSRRGPLRANKAVAHSIIVAVFHMLRDGVAFSDLGADFFERRRPEHRARQLVRQLNHLGYTVQLNPGDAA